MKTKHFARAAAIACTVMSTSAFAHEVKTMINGVEVTQDYKGYYNFDKDDCCSRVHCHPLPASRLQFWKDGTVIINPPAGVDGIAQQVISPSSKKRATAPSMDGQYHECTLNGEKGGTFICLIAPDGKMASASPPGLALASFMPSLSGVRQRLAGLMARYATPTGPVCRGNR